MTNLTVRSATSADSAAAERLARLDSTTPLRGPALLAEADGRLVAALSLEDGRAVADPFTYTEGALALLELRAGQVRQPERRRAAPALRWALAR